MNNSEREALDFLREFDISSRNYFLCKGLADSELPMALLEAQWQLLTCILQSKLSPVSRLANHRGQVRSNRNR